MTKRHDIIWLDKADSTNREASRRISDLDNLSVLSAYEQTSGRGQRGNSWSSNAGENLTFSILLKFSGQDHTEDGLLPAMHAHDQFALSEITAISVADLLSLHGITAKIKWPNDIYVGDKKICGILIENSLKGEYISSSIIGIGLNVNQTEFDPSLPNPSSMAICNEKTYHCEELLEEFMTIFKSNLDHHLCQDSDFRCLRKIYISRMWRFNETSRFIDLTTHPSDHLDGPVNICMADSGSSGDFTGIIRGLSDIGMIQIEDTEKGELREFAFKEISFII